MNKICQINYHYRTLECLTGEIWLVVGLRENVRGVISYDKNLRDIPLIC